MSKLIGTGPNQVPSNADLGTLAYQNKERVTIENIYLDRPGGDPRIFAPSGYGVNIDGERLYLNRYTNQNVHLVSGGGNVTIGNYVNSGGAKLEVTTSENINGYSDGAVQVVSSNPMAFVAPSNLNPSLNRWGFKLRENSEGDFSIHDYRQGATRLLIDDNGNVGVGRDAPTAPENALHAKDHSSTTGQLLLQGDQNDAYMRYNKSGVTWSHGIDASDSGKFKFSNNSALGTGTRITIQTDGKVGINDTTPEYILDVNGAVRAQKTGSDGGLRLHTNSGIVADSNYMGFFTGQTSGWAFSNNSTGTVSPVVTISAAGDLSANSKSFDVEHPTKEGMRLHHGSLEGPEHGVYVRGRLKDSNIIELPDYWTGLVDEDTITVQLTAIGSKQDLWIEDIIDNTIIVGCEAPVNCFYFVQAERKDVDRFDVEYEA